MHGAVAHHLLTDAQPVHQQQLTTPGQLPTSLYTERHILWYGLSLWPARVSCPVIAASLLLMHVLTISAWEMQSSCFRVNGI